MLTRVFCGVLLVVLTICGSSYTEQQWKIMDGWTLPIFFVILLTFALLVIDGGDD